MPGQSASQTCAYDRYRESPSALAGVEVCRQDRVRVSHDHGDPRPATARQATICHSSCDSAIMPEPTVDSNIPRKNTRAWPYLSPILAPRSTNAPSIIR